MLGCFGLDGMRRYQNAYICEPERHSVCCFIDFQPHADIKILCFSSNAQHPLVEQQLYLTDDGDPVVAKETVLIEGYR
jgi:hypothetical protein